VKIRRLSTDGYIEYELEKSEYHLVLRCPEWNWLYRHHLRVVSVAFTFDTLDTEELHEKSSTTTDDGALELFQLDAPDPEES